MVLATNAPPSGGVVHVAPRQGGVAVSTSFQFAAVGWVDADLPLRFRFAWLDGDPSAAAGVRRVHLCEPTSTNTLVAKLSAGSASSGFRVRVLALASDMLGAEAASAAVNVTVRPYVRTANTSGAARPLQNPRPALCGAHS